MVSTLLDVVSIKVVNIFLEVEEDTEVIPSVVKTISVVPFDVVLVNVVVLVGGGTVVTFSVVSIGGGSVVVFSIRSEKSQKAPKSDIRFKGPLVVNILK